VRLAPACDKIDGGGYAVSESTEPQPAPPAPDPQPRRIKPAAWALIGAAGLIVLAVLGFFVLRPAGRTPQPAAPPTVPAARASLAARILASGPAPWRSPTPGPVLTARPPEVSEQGVTPLLAQAATLTPTLFTHACAPVAVRTPECPPADRHSLVETVRSVVVKSGRLLALLPVGRQAGIWYDISSLNWEPGQPDGRRLAALDTHEE
jgi:hypothetical protein